MKLQNLVGTVILAATVLSGCVENIPCSEIWRYQGMPEYEALAKKCPEQAAAAEQLRSGTFKKSTPREW